MQLHTPLSPASERQLRPHFLILGQWPCEAATLILCSGVLPSVSVLLPSADRNEHVYVCQDDLGEPDIEGVYEYLISLT